MKRLFFHESGVPQPWTVFPCACIVAPLLLTIIAFVFWCLTWSLHWVRTWDWPERHTVLGDRRPAVVEEAKP